MNIALSALLIILFLLPAFFFRIGASINPRRKKRNLSVEGAIDDLIHRNVRKAFSKLTFTETIFLFSIVPILLHLIAIFLINYQGGQVDYQLLLNIFSGKDDVIAKGEAHLFSVKLINFLLYSLIQALLGLLLGIILSGAVGGKKWVLRILMGNNIWFKIFSGHSLTAEQKKELAFIVVEVLTVTKEASIVYSGILKNYEVGDQSDSLAFITLTGASRRDLRSAQITYKAPDTSSAPGTPSAETLSTYFDTGYGDIINLPGHLFTIPGKEMLNVNVVYMKFEQDEATGENVPVPIGESLSLPHYAE